MCVTREVVIPCRLMRVREQGPESSSLLLGALPLQWGFKFNFRQGCYVLAPWPYTTLSALAEGAACRRRARVLRAANVLFYSAHGLFFGPYFGALLLMSAGEPCSVTLTFGANMAMDSLALSCLIPWVLQHPQ